MEPEITLTTGGTSNDDAAADLVVVPVALPLDQEHDVMRMDELEQQTQQEQVAASIRQAAPAASSTMTVTEATAAGGGGEVPTLTLILRARQTVRW